MAGLTDIVDFIKSKFTPQETETEVVQEEVNMPPPPERPHLELSRTMLIEDHPTDYIEGAQDRVHEKIKKYNKNPNAVVGIMANMLGENDTFDYKRKQDGGGPGHGLFQFDYMKKHYNEYLDSNQIPDSENAQIHWAMDQIYTDNPNDSVLGGTQARKLRSILENASTPEEATIAFFEIFENPSPNDPKRRQKKLDKRLKNIKKFETKATGGMVMRDPYYNYNKQRAI